MKTDSGSWAAWTSGCVGWKVPEGSGVDPGRLAPVPGGLVWYAGDTPPEPIYFNATDEPQHFDGEGPGDNKAAERKALRDKERKAYRDSD